MHFYLIAKTLHFIFVMAFVATLFYLPRIMVNLSEAQRRNEGEAVKSRLVLMGMRLYRFGHVMFGLAFILGLLMWQGYRLSADDLPQAFAVGGWLHAKLVLVVLMIAYFTYFGRKLKAYARHGGALPSPTVLRWLNEAPLILVGVVVYLALGKPF